MSCVCNGENKPKEGDEPDVTYGPAARQEIARIATRINRERGYFVREADRLFRMAEMPEAEGGGTSAGWTRCVLTTSSRARSGR